MAKTLASLIVYFVLTFSVSIIPYRFLWLYRRSLQLLAKQINSPFLF